MTKIPINLVSASVPKEDPIIGIDLGTTNSLVAFVNRENHPEVLKEGDQPIMVPSVIHLGTKHSVLVGKDAKTHLTTDPQHTLFSVKRLLGRSYQDIASYQDFFSYTLVEDQGECLVKIAVGNRLYTPIELSGMILKELRERAERALQTPIHRAVITVPAYFNDVQRQATRDAGKLAGLDVLRILNEPTAASLSYGIGLNPKESKTVVVYDLGGGTFDLSILQIQNGVFEVLSTCGDTFLGGDDFDQALVDYWITKNNLDKSTINKHRAHYQKIRLKAEEAKKVLSYQASFNERVDGVRCVIDQQTFETLILSKVQKTITCCTQALQDARLTVDQIDEVLLVGGSTRVPLVKKTVSEFFKKSVHDRLPPEEVVALGAAVQAAILAGKQKNVVLLDVTPLSLGIETMGGLMEVLISRNAKIPTESERQYTTSVDGQVNIKIAVYQGERELVKDNRKLAEFDLKGIPPMPAGLPKVAIKFFLNADGILSVQATELRSGIQQTITVKPAYGLTEQQIEQMLLDSRAYAQSDVEQRLLLEARVEAKQMISVTERFLNKNSAEFSMDVLVTTKNYLQELRSVLHSGDKELILKKIAQLNEFTRPFAEQVMNQTISQVIREKM